MQNISVVNASMYLSVGKAVVEVDNFSPDANMWEVDDIEVGDLQRTPDGRILAWTKQAIYSATLTLNAASQAAKLLAVASQQQIRDGSKKAKLPEIKVIIENDGIVKTYAKGVITSGKPDISFGSEKQEDRSFKLKFGELSVSDFLPFVV